MSAPVTKAMVLTAGLGTRLSPITQKIPKPLVSVLNVPNILHVLFLLQRAGIRDVVMNLFHLPEQMESFFKKRSFFGMNFSFCFENPILGTGGGVKNAEKFLKDSTFILANCDFVTNIDIKHFLEKHFAVNSKASMLLVQDESRQHLYSKVGIDSGNHLVSLPKLQTCSAEKFGIFTGIHILSHEVLDFLDSKPCGINDTLYPRLMKEFPASVHGFIDDKAFWFDTGDFPAFWQTSRNLLNCLTKRDPFIMDLFSVLGTPYHEISKGVWIEKGATVPKDVTLKSPVLLGKNIRFGNGVTLGPNTIVGDNCDLGAASSIQDSILLPGSIVENTAHISQSVQFERLTLSAKAIV
jgi:NDP-sugar pyrophosphorylase family protein